MAIKFNIPAIKNKSFYKETEIPLIKNNIASINSKYGSYIRSASVYNKIPKELIEAFIFIESGGNEKAVSSANAVGLMQLTIQTANDVVRRDYKNKKFTNAEYSILKKYIGEQNAKNLLLSPMGKTDVFIIKEHLFKPELNIMLGTAYLGQIVDKLKSENDLRLDKAIILYNRGFYTNKNNLLGDYEQLLNNQPTETKNYILKLVAKNGVLDIIL